MPNEAAAKLARNAGYLHAFGICLLIAGLADGQTSSQSTPSQPSQDATELATTDAPATFRSRVNLVMVPVVVHDKQGHAIGTLKQEDFQLFDKGKQQTITKFSVEKLGDLVHASAIPVRPGIEEDGHPQPPQDTSAIPTRFIAYLFDDVHLGFPDIAQARQAAGKYLNEAFKPTDRIAVFTTSGQNMLDFTDDMAKIRETMDQIMPRPTSGRPAEQCPYMSYYMADQIVNRNNISVLQAAEQDAVVCLNLIAAGSGGLAAAMKQAEGYMQGIAQQVLSLGENDTTLALSTLKNVIRRMAGSPGQRSLVLVSAGFYLTDRLRFDEDDLLTQAIKGNVTISALDARGLYTMIPGGDASESNFGQSMQSQAVKNAIRNESDLASWGTLAELAEGTGGTFVHNSNDLEGAFARLTAAPEFIYLLGFSPQNLKFDGKLHALRVTLKNTKDVTSQARRGYYAPKHEADPAEQAKQEIQEAVFSREDLSDIPLDVQTQFFKSDDVTAKLSVLAKMDLRKLPFRKADGRNNDAVTVVSGIFDRNGNLINAMQRVITMHLRDETLSARVVGGMVIRSTFDLTPGSYVIRVVIRDTEGQLMAARNGVVEIP
jgi:VWFA-related protein